MGSLVVAGTLLVLLAAGGVLGQAGRWSPSAMGSGMMGSGMMGSHGQMGHMNMSDEEMDARHAECQAMMARWDQTSSEKE